MYTKIPSLHVKKLKSQFICLMYEGYLFVLLICNAPGQHAVNDRFETVVNGSVGDGISRRLSCWMCLRCLSELEVLVYCPGCITQQNTVKAATTGYTEEYHLLGNLRWRLLHMAVMRPCTEGWASRLYNDTAMVTAEVCVGFRIAALENVKDPPKRHRTYLQLF